MRGLNPCGHLDAQRRSGIEGDIIVVAVGISVVLILPTLQAGVPHPTAGPFGIEEHLVGFVEQAILVVIHHIDVQLWHVAS